jgi:hypothetical protein
MASIFFPLWSGRNGADLFQLGRRATPEVGTGGSADRFFEGENMSFPK